jgi:hypothetical protein
MGDHDHMMRAWSVCATGIRNKSRSGTSPCPRQPMTKDGAELLSSRPTRHQARDMNAESQYRSKTTAASQ